MTTKYNMLVLRGDYGLLTHKGYARNREELINLLKHSGIKEAANIDWGNNILTIYSLHKAFEIALKDQEHHLKEIIMLTLAYCYEEGGYAEDARYWYQQCLNESYYSNDPQYRIHLKGNLLLNSVNSINFSETEPRHTVNSIFMNEGFESTDNFELNEQILAIRYFVEAKNYDSYDSRNYEQSEVLLTGAKEICQRYEKYFLFQKLNLAVSEMLADLSYKQNNLTKALKLFQEAAVLAEKYGNKMKVAYFHKVCSRIYEQGGQIDKALCQYKKYYQLSERIYKRRSEEFSDYLFEINNLNVMENSITSLKGIKESLKSKRNIDPLTDVFNRRFWDEALEQKSDNTNPDSLITILMLDVDSFKDYNDCYGHVEGDKVLKSIGSTLKRSVRMETDIIARYGGDEFVVLLEGLGVKESKDLAERILLKIRKLHHKFLKSNITVSIGISTGCIKNRNSIESLLKEADKSLYHAKKNGKDRYIHYIDIGEDE